MNYRNKIISIEPRAWFLTDLEQDSRVGLFKLLNEKIDCGFSKIITSWQNVNPQSLPIELCIKGLQCIVDQ